MKKRRTQNHLLTEQFKSKIQQRIAEVEKTTSIELVPVFAGRASRYTIEKIAIALGFTLTFWWVDVFMASRRWSTDPYHTELWFPWVALALISMLLKSDRIFRSIIPRFIFLKTVEREARLAFLKYGVSKTALGSGILIFVSEFERAVYILGDHGFDGHIAREEWSKLGQQLARDFSKQSAGDTFLEAIDQLAQKCAKDFPPQPNQKSQLSDRVRTQ